MTRSRRTTYKADGMALSCESAASNPNGPFTATPDSIQRGTALTALAVAVGHDAQQVADQHDDLGCLSRIVEVNFPM